MVSSPGKGHVILEEELRNITLHLPKDQLSSVVSKMGNREKTPVISAM